MGQFFHMPEWFAVAVTGAIIAALGYVAKLIIEIAQAYIERKRLRRGRLLEIQSLLRASKVAYKVQRKHASTLVQSLRAKYPDATRELKGFEKVISTTFSQMDKDQKDLHAIIRSITTNTLFPTNTLILEWLRADTYFKSRRDHLAGQLSTLESHLILWLAKYQAWIPDRPEHAIIYLADEEKHGLGFPKALDSLINERTGFHWDEIPEENVFKDEQR